MGIMWKIRVLLGCCCLVQAALLALCEPIRITRETLLNCRPHPDRAHQCCLPPQNLQGPIVDFVPENFEHSRPLRVRKALQCLDGAELATYTEKLNRAYQLMRALPDEDPRSLLQQNNLHIFLGFGSAFQDGTSLPLLIHFNWLAAPWHRFFVYFHERILRFLLQDPDFSLHFWNFDNFVEGLNFSGADGCYKVGHHVPPLYADPSKPTFFQRSDLASDPSAIVDLTVANLTDPIVRRQDEEAIAINRGVMHSTMITQGESRMTFLGVDFRRGGSVSTEELEETIGAMEKTHLSVTAWYGEGAEGFEATGLDPLFYSYHAAVDRLLWTWPRLGSGRSWPTEDADFMDVEFLFFDENKLLRRVKVRDSMASEKLGYVYQRVNDDESWINFRPETLTDEQRKLVDKMKVKVGGGYTSAFTAPESFKDVA